MNLFLFFDFHAAKLGKSLTIAAFTRLGTQNIDLFKYIAKRDTKKHLSSFKNLMSAYIKFRKLIHISIKKVLSLANLTKSSFMPAAKRHQGHSYKVLNIKSKLIIILLIAGIGFSGKAQEMHGYVHSNYAGITGSFINPTSILTSKLYLDINTIGLHVNADNNYVYLAAEEYKFKHFFDMEFPTHTDIVMIGDASSIDVEREYYDRYNTDLKDAWVQTRVMGPSAMFATGNQAFGLSTSYRVMASGNSLPYDMAKFAFEGLKFYEQQNINYIDNIDFRAASMALAEVAGSYSRLLYRYNREYLAAGVTIKGLFSSGGAFGYADNIDYMVPNAQDIVLYDANGKFGTSLPVDYDNNEFNSKQLFLGKGIGFDFGFTYQKMMQGHSNRAYSAYCEVPYQPYLYRIGVSLLDVGSVKFKKNPIWIEMENASGTWENATSMDFQNVNELFQTISSEFSDDPNDPDKLIRYSDFAISLPTALSLQFDYRINNKIYVNSTWVHPLIMAEASLIRPSQIAVTPRLETDRFGLAMPLVLYNYQYPRIGLSARFYNIIIGTDKLGSFFGLSDFTGMDFYVMVKFQFLRGNCGRGSKNFGCGNLEYKQQY